MNPIKTAQARFGPKAGWKGHCELQASMGTWPYLSGTAVIQVGVAVAVPEGLEGVAGVGVAIAGRRGALLVSEGTWFRNEVCGR